MEKIYITKIDEVLLHIECTLSQSLELKEYFSYHIKDYKYHPQYKQGVWNGKISLFKYETLPIGLYKELISFSKRFNYEIVWDIPINEMLNDISEKEITDFYKVIFKNSKYYPRDYQHESVYKLIRKKRGIIEAATGSGKSLISYCLTRFLLALDIKILIIVPNISLTEQLFSDYNDYGWDSCKDYVSILHSKTSKFNKDAPILISTWQSIYKKSKSFFKDFDAVIVDECHTSSAYNLTKILEKCVNAEYRVGMTGTLPEQLCDRMSIIGHIGPVRNVVKASELIDKDILSNITIANLLLKYTPEEVSYMKRRPYQEEVRFYAEHKHRNKIFKYIVDHVDSDDNILILVRLIDQLHSIKKYLKENFPDRTINEIYGKTDVEIRESLRKNMNEQKGNILVCTYATMSVGVNIKRIHHIIFGSSTKSKIRTLQSIGRGLRKHESKKKLILWDIVDDLRYVTRNGNIYENHVFKHFKERLRYYEHQGFLYMNKKVNIEKI